MLQFIVIPWIN